MPCLHWIIWIIPLLVSFSLPGWGETISSESSGRETISLASEWSFSLDPQGVGESEKWFAAELPNTIQLPGSTDQGGYGEVVTETSTWHLSRLRTYTGCAWYQREVEIPASWKGKRITFLLERCHWKTTLWADEIFCGSQESLCVPHVYELPASLKPGKHRITICVDNAIQYPIGDWSHAITEHTQSNWNGIIGRIELTATDRVWIKSVQVYPDIQNKTARMEVKVGNHTGKSVIGMIQVGTISKDTTEKSINLDQLVLSATETGCSLTLPMGKELSLWSEFEHTLYNARVILDASSDGIQFHDESQIRFGMREFRANHAHFTNNSQPVFLRGTLECCIFPLTGYPAMQVEEWARIFSIARSYGLNHMRFHSWCPPEAAFQAADEAGFYLQVELPLWASDVGKNPPRDRFIREEMDRILETYGNHPSFCLLCMGNELGGELSFLENLVKHGQQSDPRHLYTSMTAWNTTPSDDYRVTHKTEKGPVRGLHGPATDWDYRESLAGIKIPVVAHETSQWTIYPNFEEIPKYTGVFRARNFEIFREDLAKKNLLDLAPQYVRASGALMLLLYKEDIEAALRTPGFGGFQLLDVHDFPGQGTALVGMLDPFWDSKGLITPEVFSHYCGPTVPLARFPKRVWTTNETFTADVDLYHYGPAALKGIQPAWELVDKGGKPLASGKLEERDVETGGLARLGRIEVPLHEDPAPRKVVLRVFLADNPTIQNSWDHWIYPSQLETLIPDGITFVQRWDEETRMALTEGKRVFLAASPETPLFHAIPANFKPPFWSPLLFASEQGGMSLLCDPQHPALAVFPTEFHTNWQWWDVMTGSRQLVLDQTPPAFRPFLQVVDSFAHNRKLGLAFEARVGQGKILVTALDLVTDLEKRPATRQLRHSLMKYVASPSFNPSQVLEVEDLDRLFEEPLIYRFRSEPKDLSSAVLHVRASMNTPQGEPKVWTRDQDEVITCKEGFQYEIRGSCWRDETGSAWHDRKLGISINCPKGFQGTLYAHLHDWNEQGRACSIAYERQNYGEIGEYSGSGFWIALPVTDQDTGDGALDLMATLTRGPNVMIREFALMDQ